MSGPKLPVVEIIIINPAHPTPSKTNQAPPKKGIHGPHFKRQRNSVKGRPPIVKRGLR